MIILTNVVIILFSLCMMPQIYYNKDYAVLAIVILLCFILGHSVCKILGDFLNGSYVYSNKIDNLFGSYYNGYEYGTKSLETSNGKYEKYMPKKIHSTYSNEMVINKCKIRDSEMDFTDTEVLYKRKEEPLPVKKEPINVAVENVQLPPIKEVVKKEINKKSSIDNLFTDKKESFKCISLFNDSYLSKEKKIAYDVIIDVIKSKRYPTSKNCILLKAFKAINVMCYNTIPNKYIEIFLDEREFDGSYVIPRSEIKDALRKAFNKHDLKVDFYEYKALSVFDVYAETLNKSNNG